MFDSTSPPSLKNISWWYKSVVSICGKDIPMVLCRSKADLEHQELRRIPTEFNNMKFYEISSKSNYNFEKPFLHLARELTGCKDLVFIENPAKFLPEINITF